MLTLRTELGLVQLTTDYGQDPPTRKWFCPQQRAGGLTPHQKITPGLAAKLCFTAVATPWGVAVDDAVIHQQVQRAGERADQQAEARVAASADPPAPQTGSPTAALAIMMLDGWPLRQRGDDWSRKPADAVGERGAWQECKSAVIYRLQQAVKKNGRGLLVEKFVVAYLGDPLEFGRRVPQVFVVADGAVWIWNLAADRFASATGVLDFRAFPTMT